MEDKYSSNSYRRSASFGSDCHFYGEDENEPCWGDVSVVGEEGCGEDDYMWIHECKGHEDCYDAKYYSGDAKYKAEQVCPV